MRTSLSVSCLLRVLRAASAAWRGSRTCSLTASYQPLSEPAFGLPRPNLSLTSLRTANRRLFASVPQSQRRTGRAELPVSADPTDAHDLHTRAAPDSHSGHGGSGDCRITVAFLSPGELWGNFGRWNRRRIPVAWCSRESLRGPDSMANRPAACHLPPARRNDAGLSLLSQQRAVGGSPR